MSISSGHKYSKTIFLLKYFKQLIKITKNHLPVKAKKKIVFGLSDILFSRCIMCIYSYDCTLYDFIERLTDIQYIKI